MKNNTLNVASYSLAILTATSFFSCHFLLTKTVQHEHGAHITQIHHDAFGFVVASKFESSKSKKEGATASSLKLPVAKIAKPAVTTIEKVHSNDQRNDTSVTTVINSPLGDFFRLLCNYNVTDCCRNESRLELLDQLSLTLGTAQTYDQIQFGKLPPPSAAKPVSLPDGASLGTNNSLAYLNCSHYQYELTKPPPINDGETRHNITTTREVVNSFRRRRLVYIPPNVNRRLLRPMFLDPPTQKPREMVDVLMVSHELDILQARMQQFYSVMEHFVIIESAFNHRGWKKHRFVQEELTKPNNRFQHFQDKLIYLDVDTCPLYIATVQNIRTSGQGVGSDVWPIQESMRECVWPLLKPRLVHLSDSALVMMADLDWLPCKDDLLHIRHCEPSQAFGSYNTHIRMGLKQKMRASFVREKPGKDLLNEHFSLTPLGRIRKDDRLHLRGYPPSRGPYERKMFMHPIICGIHLQLMGSLANIIYREVTHAEGSYLDRFHRVLNGKTYCEIDDEFLRHQQESLSQHSEYFHWRHPPPNFEPSNVTINSEGQVTVSDDHLQALRNAQVPSALFDYRQLYPFYWGQGTFEMYSKNYAHTNGSVSPNNK